MENQVESPNAVRLSLAAAMTLGFKRGLFFRDARLHCINLLETYRHGCIASCAYCGLSREREGEHAGKSFIRVTWPTHGLDEVIGAMKERSSSFGRICISMVTHPSAARDLVTIARRIREAGLGTPLSALLSPTVTTAGDLVDIREAGVDRVGIAVDAATPGLFDRLRGDGVKAPHRWDRYWQAFEEAVDVFGQGRVGSHFMVGLGETEKEMALCIQKARDLGGCTHLFSFFPEAGSAMQETQPPAIGQYRRIQIARYLIDEGMAEAGAFTYSGDHRIVGFGVSPEELERVISCGEPFRTSGCPGEDGEVACNRPFANETPGHDIRNYPFAPSAEDIRKIRNELGF